MCGWEDDENQEEEPDDPRGANGMSLNEYKKQYEEKLKKNPNYVWEEEIDKYDSIKKCIKKHLDVRCFSFQI